MVYKGGKEIWNVPTYVSQQSEISVLQDSEKNPMESALEAGFLQSLIREVTQDPKDGVSRKAIFALSCLVRGFPYGQQVLCSMVD